MLHLFLELTTLLFFALVSWHAVKRRGRFGALFIASLLLLGFVRENFVTLKRLLYGYADLHLELGAAPLIASIIWPYSVYVACCFAEQLSGRRLEEAYLRPVFLAWVAIFMVSLVGFYEPLLDRVGMARWQEGTRLWAGAPWIAAIGYPTLAVGSTVLFASILRAFTAWRLALTLTPAIVLLATIHAWGLQELKNLLAW